MIKFKIDEVSYSLPDFVSIENYSKIFKVKDLFNEDYFAAKLVNIVSGAPLNILLESEYQEISFLAATILNKIPFKDVKFVDRFELDGVQYGFFPNWRDLTFAEYVDLDTISTKPTEELLDMLHYLAAIMYRPIIEETSSHNFQIEKYDVDSMKRRAEYFKKNLDIKYVLGGQFFFIKFAERLLEYSPVSLTKKMSFFEMIKLIWTMWRMIYKLKGYNHSVGSQWSTELQKMISQNTKNFIK
jgi:hypothetical protein